MNRKRPPSKTFVGRVVRLSGNKLTIKIRNGKKRTYTVADEATIISDGMADTLEQIQIGQNIRVTTRKRDFHFIHVIESLRNNADFPSLSGAHQ